MLYPEQNEARLKLSLDGTWAFALGSCVEDQFDPAKPLPDAQPIAVPASYNDQNDQTTALRRHYLNWLCLPTDFNYTAEQLNDLKREDVAKVLYERGMSILESKEQKYGAPMMRELERICLLRNVDSKWMEHIDNMDQLKQGMSLRGYGQRDPIVEYRIEGFAMFDEMIATIREDAVHMLLTIEVRQQNQEPKREQVAKPTGEGAPAQAGAKGATPVRVTKIGRNDPCPCGSGLKWKKCTCKEYHPDL